MHFRPLIKTGKTDLEALDIYLSLLYKITVQDDKCAPCKENTFEINLLMN
jgi:hypothetical protein